VITVDRFGNAITNIDRRTFERAAASRVRVMAGGHEIGTVVSTYSEAATGEPCALFGSTDHLELAIAGGSAAGRLGLTPGTAVRIERVS
jgi:S-adenosylmethionine hydrolase